LYDEGRNVWEQYAFDPAERARAGVRVGLSHSTVKQHLTNARSKVGAEMTAQPVWIVVPRLPEPEQVAQSGE
jgi:hypothetical protein